MAMQTVNTPEGHSLDDEYASNERLAEVFFKRATGQSPEMEVSKAIAKLVAERSQPGDTILDVGCGAGHYLRSLKRLVPEGFKYVGVDYYQHFLDKAEAAWREEPSASFRQGSIFDLPVSNDKFDIVICSNLIMHLPSISKPVAELVRAGRRLVIIRTMIGEKSFQIKEVYNSNWWPDTDVSPDREFDDEGQPRAFAYHNIYSMDYLSNIIRRHAPNARIEYMEDDQFSPENIQRSAETEGLVNATRIVDGKQVFGYIIKPYNFVIIDLSD